MKERKHFDHGPEKRQPRAGGEARVFGTSDPERAHFGRNGTPWFGGLAEDRRGVAMIEYALICAFIALAIVAGVTQLGGGVSDGWDNVDNEVGSATVFTTS